VQRNKGQSKNKFKIEISIKTSVYSVKFDACKKEKKRKKWFYRNIILLPRLDLEEFWHTVMADGATD